MAGLKQGLKLFATVYLTFFFFSPETVPVSWLAKVMEVNQHFSDTVWSVTGFILWILGFVYLWFTIPILKSPTLAILSWFIIVSLIGEAVGFVFSWSGGLDLVIYVIDLTLFIMYFGPVGLWKAIIVAILNVFTMHGALDVNIAYYTTILLFMLGTAFIVDKMTDFYWGLAEVDVKSKMKGMNMRMKFS